MPIIAISGPHGSGKSTAAKKVAELLNYTYISAGQMFREMAKDKGMNLEEFSKNAEANEEIDRSIDNRTLDFAQIENGIIIDAQLGGWVLRKVADLIIYITAPVKTRIQRIAERENRSIEEIKKETLMREESERHRYQKLYNIDVSDLSIYDVIINTKKYDAAECVDIIMASVKKITKGDTK
ncbi:MAG: AAA family ATPase [Candidatus Heimdallarchaeota archaeon]|nr:AAA family ATPase [Candidatus Heimdallarchaeota archaeon]